MLICGILPWLLHLSTLVVGQSNVLHNLEERLNFSIREGSPIGSDVGKVRRKPGFTYRLQEASPYFEYDGKTGQIRTSGPIDRERFRSDHVTLIILSSEPTYLISAEIKIVDVNDNAPVFPFSFQNITISESAQIGSDLPLWTASDADSGENGAVVTYRLLSGNDENKFSLVFDADTARDSLRLKLLSPLDRERRSHYVLNITAQDSGSPPLSGFLSVFVTVVDVNDNAPTFNQSDFKIDLMENAPKGTEVFQASAVDLDVGQNSEFRYQLEPAASVPDILSIDSNSGIITLSGLLSGCPTPKSCQSNCQRSCVFRLTAVDHGNPPQVGRAFLHVHVVDINDHAPEINFRYHPEEAPYAVVAQTADIGAVVAVITTTDQDEGENGNTTIRLLSGNEAGYLSLDTTSIFGLVRLQKSLKYARKDKFNLTFEAVDGGSPPLRSRKNLVIYVKGSELEAPEFKKASYSVSVGENAPQGTYLTAVSVKQPTRASRLPGMAEIELEPMFEILPSNSSSLFAIDAGSGVVTVNGEIDYEEVQHITLTIRAKWSQPSALGESTANVHVTILDENDNRPSFQKSTIRISVPEDAKPGKILAKVTAIDADTGLGGRVAYSLSPNAPLLIASAFDVDANSGDVILRRALDRESIDNYRFDIVAADGGNPPLSAAASVEVTVQDVNDNRPILYPVETWVSLLESSEQGTIILRAQARDPDIGENGRVAYSVLQSVVSSVAIDRYDGTLRLQRVPFGRKSMDVVIGAEDSGGQAALENTTVHITFVASSEVLPKFTRLPKKDLSIIESNRIATRAVATVTAVDSESKHQVVYHITNGDQNGDFEIGSFSGELRAVHTIDRERTPIYNLEITAVGARGSRSATVTIEVTDINDNSPVFPGNISHIHIYVENSWPTGYPVHYVEALDADSGENGALIYELRGCGKNYLGYGMDPYTGVLRLLQPSEFLDSDDCENRVTVSDHGTPQHSTALGLTIHQDKNESLAAALKVRAITNLFVKENGRPFVKLEQVAAGPLLVESIGQSIIGISPDGWISLHRSLDYETAQFHTGLFKISRPRSNDFVLAEVNVYVLDIDDNKISCQFREFSAQIPENAPPLTWIVAVPILDADRSTYHSLAFELDDQNNDFGIDRASGLLYSLRPFDREELIQTAGSPNISLSIKACNIASNDCTTCKVLIEVQDENDNAPIFAKSRYAVSIPENQLPLSPVLQVSADDADDHLNGQVSYHILEHEEFFEIDPDSGQISLKNVSLDREAISSHVFHVQACDSSITAARCSRTKISIDLVDVNDNTPEGINNPGYLNVSELAPVGFELANFRAFDPDAGANGKFRFAIETGNIGGVFAVDPISGDLFVQRALDFEARPLYTLTITATDQGIPPRKSTFPVVLHVQDENDHEPMVSGSSLTGRIPENMPKGSLVLTVNASDPDSGDAGNLRYYIVEQQPSAVFEIDHYTGDIRTTTVLDREDADTYDLEVEVADSPLVSAKQHRVRRLVTILVTDQNDHAPRLLGAHAVTVSALATAGYKITKLLGTDRDLGINGSIGFKMTSSSDHFGIGVDGSVYLRSQISRAVQKPTYSINVELFDRYMASVPYNPKTQGDSLSTSYALTLILDPETQSAHLAFAKPEFEFEVFENETIGAPIGRLAMINSFKEGQLGFYITEIVSNGKSIEKSISLDDRTATLSVKSTLDREATEFIELTVVAADLKDLQLARCKVKLKLLDINDTPPTLNPLIRRVTVSEGQQIGTTVFVLSAQDPDVRGSLVYTFDNVSTPFDVDPTSGVVSLKTSLDRESTAEYRLSYRVNDGPHTTKGKVVVSVGDVNDNVPAFRKHAYFFLAWTGVPRGSYVGAVTAADSDSGVNATVSYYLHGSDQGFEVDEITGVIRTKEGLRVEKTILLEIQAIDKGYPPLSSTVQVFVTITSRHVPKMSQNRLDLEAKEDLPVGKKLTELVAERTYPAPIRYSIEGDPDGLFAITPEGHLILSSPLDRESSKIHRFTISTYYAVPKAIWNQFDRSIIEVQLNVTDVNDNKPIFAEPTMSSVREGAPAGTPVGQLSASDADDGINAKFYFGLASEHQDRFYVDPVTGVISTNVPLDFEEQSVHNLTVYVTDYGSPQLTTEGSYVVYVVNTNDIEPTFAKSIFEGNIEEGTLPGTTVIVLRTISEENSPKYFQIEDETIAAIFDIVPQTGELILKQKLPPLLDFLNFTVLLSNLGQETPPATAQVLLKIKKVNLHKPVFPNDQVTFDLYENLTVGLPALIGRVRAIDLDSGVNAKLSYAIIQGNTSVFSVDAVSGEIFVVMAVDRELIEAYELTVTATDSGLPRLSGSCHVTVAILDMNDNAPVFHQPYYVLDVGEDAPVGLSIGDVVANDADAGMNGRVRYALTPTSPHFSIDTTTGALKVASLLDRETTAQHRLRVTATDESTLKPLASKTDVLVNVLDVNDNAPTIKHPRQGDVYVQERNGGSPIFIVGVTDHDIGENSELTFDLTQGSGTFSIDNQGVVRAKATLQYGQEYPLTVRVRDNGGAISYNDSRTYQVKVGSSQNFPVCSSGDSDNLTISEAETRELIGQVTARSSKQPPFNRISFSLVSGNVGSGFDIDANSGKLWTTDFIDREIADKVTLWIAARDNDNPSLVSYCSVDVKVTDANDNSPKFDRAVYEAKVSEHLPPGQPIVQVEATDPDLGPSGKPAYDIISGNDDASFKIDPETGEIRTTVSLDRELLSQYRLQVAATDNGVPKLTGTADVIIDVLDINDNAPRFTRLLTASVPENAPLGTDVVTAQAIDLDLAENANNTYYFSKNPGRYFTIDSYSGLVTLSKLLDREKIAEHQLKVVAMDDIWRIETNLIVTVLDLNDNKPVFNRSEYIFNMHDSISTPHVLGLIQASDADEQGRNSELIYSLSEPHQFFYLNPSNGQLSIESPLKSLSKSIFDLTITATDLGTPALSSSAHVKVKVHETNINPPKFEVENYQVPLLPGLVLKTPLLRVRATDPDGPVRYETDATLFDVDSEDGSVTLLAPLNSTSGNYTFAVTAIDSQYPPLTDTCTVTLFASNSVRPQVPAKLNLSLPISHPVGVTFHKFEITVTSNLKFEKLMSKDAEYFDVRQNGEIALAKTLSDHPNQNVFKFWLTVGYIGLPHDESMDVSVTVSVKGILAFEAAVLEYFPSCGAHVWVDSLIEKLHGCARPSFFLKNSTFTHLKIDQNTGEVKGASRRAGQPAETTADIEARCEATNEQATSKLLIHLPTCNFHQVFLEDHYVMSVPLVLEERALVGFLKTNNDDASLRYLLDAESESQGFGVENGAIFAKSRMNTVPDRYNMTVFALPRHVTSASSFEVTGHATVTLHLSQSLRSQGLPYFEQTAYWIELTSEGNETEVFSIRSILNNPPVTGWEHFLEPAGGLFKVDPISGRISAIRELENGVEYSLTVGVVHLASKSKIAALLNIRKSRWGGHSSFLTPENTFARVLENRPPGSHVLVLYPQKPARMQIVDDAGAFALDSTGVLKTTTTLDREKQRFFYPKLRITDLDPDRQGSEEVVLNIEVADENDNPSTPGRFDVNVRLIEGLPVNTVSIPVQPRDPDALGKYTCTLRSELSTGLRLKGDACSLSLTPKKVAGNEAVMMLSGNDGHHPTVEYEGKISIDQSPKTDTDNAVGIILDKHQLQYAGLLIESLSKSDLLKSWKILGYDSSKPALILKPSNTQSNSDLANLLARVRKVAEETGLAIRGVEGRPCASQKCQNGGQCQEAVNLSGPYLTFDTNVSNSWVLPQIQRSFECNCREEYSGPLCEFMVRHCDLTPCQNGGNCTSKNGKVVCECKAGFTGDRCQHDVNECATVNPCKNGGYCENVPGSYRCICLMGFSGNHCDQKLDACSSTPCQNGGTCLAASGDYTCNCAFGFSGRNCESTSIGLDFDSYLKLPSLDTKSNVFALVFATVEPNALLLLSYNERVSISQDYLAVDIVQGQLRLTGRILGETLKTVRLEKSVNDGNWYQLTLKQENEIVIMSLGECPQSGSACKQCMWGDSSCHVSVNTRIYALPIANHAVYLGSVQHFPDLVALSGILAHFGFRGCVRSLVLNGKDLATIVRGTNVKKIHYSCRRLQPQCGDSCGKGTCIDRWDEHTCSCPRGYFAEWCENGDRSLSLAAGDYVELRPSESQKKYLQFTPLTPFTKHSRGTRQAALAATRGERIERRAADFGDFEHEIRFKFRTKKDNGALFWAAKESNPEEHIFVNIINQTVHLGVKSLRARPVLVALEKMNSAADGAFHEVMLKYSSEGQKAEIQLDSYGKAIKFNDPVPPLIAASSRIVFGASPQSVAYAARANTFEGCLVELVIDGELIDLWSSSNRSSPYLVSAHSPSGGLAKKECDHFVTCDDPPCPVPEYPSSNLHPGVITVIIFLVLLMIVLVGLFTAYHMRKSSKKSTTSSKSLAVVCGNDFTNTAESRLTSLGSWASSQKSNNENPIYATPSHAATHVPLRPVLLPQRHGIRQSRDSNLDVLSPVSYFGGGGGYSNRVDPTAGEYPERYDLDNASSIAPSDVDVAYHYRGYNTPPGRPELGSIGRSVSGNIMMSVGELRYPSSAAGTSSIGRSRRPRRAKESRSAGSPASSLHSAPRAGSSHRHRNNRSRSSRRKNITPADILSSPANIIDSSSSSEAVVQRRRAPPSRSSSRRRSNAPHATTQRDSSTELPSSEDERTPPANVFLPPRSSLMSSSHLSVGGTTSPWDQIPPRIPPHVATIPMTTDDDETDHPDDAVPDLSSFINRSGELNNLFTGRNLSSSEETISHETQH